MDSGHSSNQPDEPGSSEAQEALGGVHEKRCFVMPPFGGLKLSAVLTNSSAMNGFHCSGEDNCLITSAGLSICHWPKSPWGMIPVASW